jgi:methionine biosynthesis protein MetW
MNFEKWVIRDYVQYLKQCSSMETKGFTNKIFYAKNFAKSLDPNTSDRLQTVVKVLASSHSHRLLDIGCGDGSLVSLLKDIYDEIYGIDIADEAVASAIERGIKAITVDIDSEDLPFQDNYFDVVYCGDLIEHLYDPDHLIDEIKRTLVPGGTCVLSTPNLASWLNRLVLLFGFQPFNTEVSLRRNVGKLRAKEEEVSGHIRVFPYRSLKELIEWHGLIVDRFIGIDSAKNLPVLAKQIDKVLSRKVSLASYLVVVMRKPLQSEGH